MESKLFVIAAVIGFTITHSFAQDDGIENVYRNVVAACEENKTVKLLLDRITKKNAKVIDVYDNSERGEKAKYERNVSEIDIIKVEGPKVVNAYADCLKTKMQGKEFRNQSKKINVSISITNDGRLVNNTKTVTDRPVKKGKKTKIEKPKVTFGKSLWCSDEIGKCTHATIIVEQK